MVGIVVVSHGKLCEALVDSASMSVGRPEQLETIALMPGMSPDDYRAQLREAVERLDTGKGVLVLADLICGTPANCIAFMLKDLHMAAVTGANLPMVMTVAIERTEEHTLEELVALAEETALDSIKVLKR